MCDRLPLLLFEYEGRGLGSWEEFKSSEFADFTCTGALYSTEGDFSLIAGDSKGGLWMIESKKKTISKLDQSHSNPLVVVRSFMWKDRYYVALGHKKGEVKIVEFEKSRNSPFRVVSRFPIKGPKDVVSQLCSMGKFLCTGGGSSMNETPDFTLKLWNVETKENVHTYNLYGDAHTSDINVITVLKRGENGHFTFLSAGDDNVIAMWTTEHPSMILKLKGLHSSSWITSLHILSFDLTPPPSPPTQPTKKWSDDFVILSCSDDRDVILFDLQAHIHKFDIQQQCDFNYCSNTHPHIIHRLDLEEIEQVESIWKTTILSFSSSCSYTKTKQQRRISEIVTFLSWSEEGNEIYQWTVTKTRSFQVLEPLQVLETSLLPSKDLREEENNIVLQYSDKGKDMITHLQSVRVSVKSLLSHKMRWDKEWCCPVLQRKRKGESLILLVCQCSELLFFSLFGTEGEGLFQSFNFGLVKGDVCGDTAPKESRTVMEIKWLDEEEEERDLVFVLFRDNFPVVFSVKRMQIIKVINFEHVKNTVYDILRIGKNENQERRSSFFDFEVVSEGFVFGQYMGAIVSWNVERGRMGREKERVFVEYDDWIICLHKVMCELEEREEEDYDYSEEDSEDNNEKRERKKREVLLSVGDQKGGGSYEVVGVFDMEREERINVVHLPERMGRKSRRKKNKVLEMGSYYIPFLREEQEEEVLEKKEWVWCAGKEMIYVVDPLCDGFTPMESCFHRSLITVLSSAEESNKLVSVIPLRDDMIRREGKSKFTKQQKKDKIFIFCEEGRIFRFFGCDRRNVNLYSMKYSAKLHGENSQNTTKENLLRWNTGSSKKKKGGLHAIEKIQWIERRGANEENGGNHFVLINSQEKCDQDGPFVYLSFFKCDQDEQEKRIGKRG